MWRIPWPVITSTSIITHPYHSELTSSQQSHHEGFTRPISKNNFHTKSLSVVSAQNFRLESKYSHAGSERRSFSRSFYERFSDNWKYINDSVFSGQRLNILKVIGQSTKERFLFCIWSCKEWSWIALLARKHQSLHRPVLLKIPVFIENYLRLQNNSWFAIHTMRMRFFSFSFHKYHNRWFTSQTLLLLLIFDRLSRVPN